MSTAGQLLRSLRVSAQLLGLAERQRELADQGEKVGLDDVLDLLWELQEAVAARAEQEEARGASEAVEPLPRARSGPRSALSPEQLDQLLVLARQGTFADREIAEALGTTPMTVRYHRRQAGIARPSQPTPTLSGWQDTIRALHAQGLRDAEIAEKAGFTSRTVQEYRHRLGLRANRS